ncbi:FMN-binding protein [Streptomyces galbus]|uniref:FMN-binding protein n=1 Tax=Streptomyces galbus TaxID=33898 RepID=A0A4U5WYR2_STRGB|nr:FMN-binding protein [Streptomyces galbus]TKT07460.1 FMN-binding protein [Streptomyces galbus]GHD37205.1 FMN-binding protein [Streptomyces galbus]
MHPLRKTRPLRRTVLACAGTVSAFVLLLSLKPHSPPEVTAAPAPSSSASAPGGSGGSGSGGGSASGTRTVTGEPVQTRWGPVQVRVTVTDGRITDVTAVTYPRDNPRDQQINSYALPELRSEALRAQSADIDTVSGATYTSDGYRESLQSALDAAGL